MGEVRDISGLGVNIVIGRGEKVAGVEEAARLVRQPVCARSRHRFWSEKQTLPLFPICPDRRRACA